jgi:hypothetical protein
MADHRWNIGRAKENALKQELEKAKDKNEHDRITSIAADLAKQRKQNEKYLRESD